MIRLLIAFIILTGHCAAQQFDGICRLSCNGAQWSGVAISTTEILTVAHHGQTTGIRAEFPERGYGAFTRLGIESTLIRDNKQADLSLLSYNCPEYATIKVYDVADDEFTDVLIRGYVKEQAKQMRTTLLHRKMDLGGYRVLSFNGVAIPGMSGSPVTTPDDVIIGIQFGITETETHAVQAATILEFLGAK